MLDGPANLINGEWEEGKSFDLEVVNPTTTDKIRSLPTADVGQADRAVAAAYAAFHDGPWASASPRQRSDLLLDLAALMEEYYEELVEIIVTEVGAPITLARAMQVGMPIDNIRWAADMALKGPQGGYKEALAPHMGPPMSSSLLQRVPVGVVAGITGYNFPINSVAWKLGPGLAAGCTLVFKPSPRTPLSTLAFMRLVDRVGFPPGVVNFVVGEAEIGSALTVHPQVDMVMFTGSLSVGQRIMSAASETTKRLVLELGGKSANIVLPGADIGDVVGPTILRWSRNAGQGCGATTRTLVPRNLYDDYVEAAREFIVDMNVGSPWKDSTDVGPLISDEQRTFVERHVADALSGGGEVIAGGGRPSDLPGYFMNPTLIGGVTNDSTICQEELFGPVGVLLPYDEVTDAIRIANDSKYGLHAAVWGPPDAAFDVAREIRAGAVSINGGGFMRPEGPWGGFKQSGFGREMGEDGFREFFEVKHLQWPI